MQHGSRLHATILTVLALAAVPAAARQRTRPAQPPEAAPAATRPAPSPAQNFSDPDPASEPAVASTLPASAPAPTALTPGPAPLKTSAPAPQTVPLKPAEKLLTQRPIRVHDLLKILRSEDPELRRDAVELLEASEPAQVQEAVPVLVHVTINDSDPRVRYAASWQLAKMGQAPASALVLSLGHPDPDVRRNAVEALGEIGPVSDVVIPSLVEALRDPKTREAAGSALARIGPKAIGNLVAALGDSTLSAPAGRTLVRIGAPAAPALARALQDEALKGPAADALTEIGLPAVGALVAAFRDGTVRELASVFVRLGRPTVPALIAAVQEGEEPVRRGAGLTLCELGPAAIESLPVLLDSVKSHPAELELYPLWKFGPAGVPVFARGAADPAADIRLLSARSLAQVRPSPLEAFTALIGRLNDDDSRVRGIAAGTLTEQAYEAVPALKQGLDSPDRDMRRAAAEALGFIGSPAEKALQPLRAALKDQDPGVRKRAAYALGQLGTSADKAAPELIEALTDDAAYWWAAEALAKIGPGTVPALLKTLRTAPDRLRFRAAFALSAVQPEAPGLRENLTEALTSKEADIRAQSAMTLSGLPALASPARPALLQALEDPDAGVRFSAGYALSRLGPETVQELLLAAAAPASPRAAGAAQALDLLGSDTTGALIAALQNPELRPAASRTLVRIGPATVPQLIAALQNELLQEPAAETLAQIGGAAVPPLSHALRSGKAFGRKGAATALKTIGSPEALAALRQASEESAAQNRKSSEQP